MVMPPFCCHTPPPLMFKYPIRATCNVPLLVTLPDTFIVWAGVPEVGLLPTLTVLPPATTTMEPGWKLTVFVVMLYGHQPAAGRRALVASHVDRAVDNHCGSRVGIGIADGQRPAARIGQTHRAAQLPVAAEGVVLRRIHGHTARRQRRRQIDGRSARSGVVKCHIVTLIEIVGIDPVQPVCRGLHIPVVGLPSPFQVRLALRLNSMATLWRPTGICTCRPPPLTPVVLAAVPSSKIPYELV